jgi:serine/threonine protein kinase
VQSGQQIGRYLLREKIGTGGMAEVFRAEERVSDGSTRVVAVKRLFPRLSAERDFVGMFVHEAQITSGMNHPNIVRTFDLINHESYYYIVMEYLKGMDLDDLLRQADPNAPMLPVPEAAYIASEVAQGLHYAHQGGVAKEGPIVHRDISPGNILIGYQGEVKVTDFGIARMLQEVSYTQPGILKGKYEYMAPEYVQGKEFDGRADLFALGIVLYETLTGKNPFEAVLSKDIFEKLVKENPPPPSRWVPAIPKSMDAVVAKALAKEPKRRFINGEEMSEILQPFFFREGKGNIAKSIGDKVRRASERGSASNKEFIAEEYLPPERDEWCERTQQAHQLELLELVEPPSGKKQHILLASGGKKRKGLDSFNPLFVFVRRFFSARFSGWAWWMSGGVAVILMGFFCWLLWPEPMGRLTVTVDMPSDVFVDGRRLSEEEMRQILLPIGVHRVEVRQQGTEKTQRYETNIEKDKEAVLQIKWRSISPQKKQRLPKKKRK